MHQHPAASGANAGYASLRLVTSLLLLTIGGSGMYASIVVLTPVIAEFGLSRSAASLPYFSAMIGFGLGGIMMGRLSDRYGVMLPVLAGGVGLAGGYFLAASTTSPLVFFIAHGLLIGFFGMSPSFAPLVADISHWFERRRGLAVAIVISGSYLAGAVWPPIIQYGFDQIGWRQTYWGLGIFCVVSNLVLAPLLYRRPPAAASAETGNAARHSGRPLGFGPGALQCLLCTAGVACCAAMAMPQVHIMALAGDLGHAAARGAEMLALMLACGIVSRLTSGWISDRIGGLRTLLLGSGMQAVALVLFMPVDSLTGLYVMSALFGLTQGGIVPSYAIIIRSYFRPGEAGWRIATVMLATMIGMAFGGWMAGMLYDLTGSYDAAFINGIGFNILNMLIAAELLRRAGRQFRVSA